jgi:hypothetical protein
VFDEETCEYILEVEDQQTERVDEEEAEGASHTIRPWYLGDGDQTHTHRCHPLDLPQRTSVRTDVTANQSLLPACCWRKRIKALSIYLLPTFSLSCSLAVASELPVFDSIPTPHFPFSKKTMFAVSRLRVQDLDGRRQLPRDYRHPRLFPSVMNLKLRGACP